MVIVVLRDGRAARSLEPGCREPSSRLLAGVVALIEAERGTIVVLAKWCRHPGSGSQIRWRFGIGIELPSAGHGLAGLVG